MVLKNITLENFRNYEKERFDFDAGINLIAGQNAQGKTNLLEGCAALSTMKLFRTGQKKEGLRFGQDSGSIIGGFRAQNMDFTMELRLYAARAMEVYRNGVRMRKQSEGQGILKTVLFCPDDLGLIRAGAAERRRFLDGTLCQMRPNYARLLEEYRRLHEHKTRILKDSEEKPSLLALLDDFTDRMARVGAGVVRYRAYYIRKLAKTAAAVHREIAPEEELQLSYRTVSTVENPFASERALYEALLLHAQRHRSAELSAKSCLSGPHKDDLEILLNGKPAAAFASQGQTRTCALVLKLSERELLYDDSGEYPLLLLDDVLSELDKRRKDFVLNRIAAGQVLITSCEEDAADKLKCGRIFHIADGHIVGAGA